MSSTKPGIPAVKSSRHVSPKGFVSCSSLKTTPATSTRQTQSLVCGPGLPLSISATRSSPPSDPSSFLKGEKKQIKLRGMVSRYLPTWGKRGPGACPRPHLAQVANVSPHPANSTPKPTFSAPTCVALDGTDARSGASPWSPTPSPLRCALGSVQCRQRHRRGRK